MGSAWFFQSGNAPALFFENAVLERQQQIDRYDPVTGTRTPTSSLNTHAGTTTLLSNGQVLFAGSNTSSELYDPATDTWTTTGSMITARVFFVIEDPATSDDPMRPGASSDSWLFL